MAFFFLATGVCANPCNENLVFPTSYLPVASQENPCPDAEERSCCLNQFALMMCDADALPSALDDTAVFEALKTAGKMVTFPDVAITQNTPTETTFTKPCGDKILVSKKQLIDIKVFSVATDHSDEKFWQSICKKNGKMNAIFKYTDDYTVMADDWVEAFEESDPLPTTQMGIPFSFTISPYLSPPSETEPCHWIMQIEIDITCNLRSALVPGLIGVF